MREPIVLLVYLYMYMNREMRFEQCGIATSKASDQPVHTHSLIRAFASRLNILSVLSY